jgi:hypothetical protein
MSKIIGVMGGSKATENDIANAETLGRLIAGKGWVLLNGGRNTGVMEASARGAADAGGLTIGILPGKNKETMSPYIKIPIITGMGDARNVINVLSSDVVVGCPGGAGTLSEIALALKSGKKVILFNFNSEGLSHFENLFSEKTPEDVIRRIELILS